MSLHLADGMLQGATAAAVSTAVVVCITGLGASPPDRGWAVRLVAEQTWRLWMRCALVPDPVNDGQSFAVTDCRGLGFTVRA